MIIKFSCFHPTSKGIIRYDTDGLSFYEGDWMSNKRHGYGVRRYRSGNVYEGEWANNNRHGQGIMRWVDLNQTYNGQWEKGVQVSKIKNLHRFSCVLDYA